MFGGIKEAESIKEEASFEEAESINDSEEASFEEAESINKEASFEEAESINKEEETETDGVDGEWKDEERRSVGPDSTTPEVEVGGWRDEEIDSEVGDTFE